MNLYLFAAYAVFWSILFAYLLLLQKRQARINREIVELAGQLEED